MNEFTPSNENLRYAWRDVRDARSFDEADAEFDRWLAAHDQGIRDACRTAEMTAREHMEAAWEAAYPVPANGRIPKGTKYLTRCGGQDVVTAEAGIDLRGGPDIRTLDPLPPSIPDDCNYVWAQVERPAYRFARIIFRRISQDEWLGAYKPWLIEECTTADLIDPVPIPKEGDR